MSVYVDKPIHRYGRMIMCHMMADTLEELHTMADTIGIDRKHFQPKSSPHYDVCKSKRELALKSGALKADKKKIVELIRKYRD